MEANTSHSRPLKISRGSFLISLDTQKDPPPAMMMMIPLSHTHARTQTSGYGESDRWVGQYK